VTSVFLCVNSVSPTCNFRSNRIFSVPPKCATRCHRLCNQKNKIATCSTFLLIQLHSMNLVLYKHHNFILCFVLSLKDQTYTTDSRKPFLEIDVKGGERDHIKACRRKRSHQSTSKLKGERKSQGSQMLLRGRERFPRCY